MEDESNRWQNFVEAIGKDPSSLTIAEVETVKEEFRGDFLQLSIYLTDNLSLLSFTSRSFFGGNPLAAAVGMEALNILVEEDLPGRSASMGTYLLDELKAINSPLIADVRGIGLFIGIEIDPSLASAREIVEALMDRGILSKETHETVVRLAPPLVITREQIDWSVTQIKETLADMDRTRLAS